MSPLECVGSTIGYCTVTCRGRDGIPLAMTSILVDPVSMLAGISIVVDTIVLPVAIPMVLWSYVRAYNTCRVAPFVRRTIGWLVALVQSSP